MDDGSTKKLNLEEINTLVKKNEKETSNNIEPEDADIDDILKKSIEKLVEEETNVAKASIHIDHADVQKKDKADNYTGKDELGDYTRQDDMMNEPVASKTANKVVKPDAKADKNKNNPKKNYKKFFIIGGAAAAVIIIIIVSVLAYSANKQTYDYNYKKGMDYFSAGDYSNAITYLEKAYKTDSGKNNADLLYSIYECHEKSNETEKEKETLKSILLIDKHDTKALTALAACYYEENDGDALNQLVDEYKNTDEEKIFEQYRAGQPSASEKSGSYTDSMDITLTAGTDEKIYYTLDGSDPSIQSKLYNDTITIDKGTTKLKAVAVNGIGVYGIVGEWEYIVDYKKPNAPVIELASGTYPNGQKVALSGIEDGCRAYYTTDGSNPTAQSQIYSEPVEIPEGNIIFSAIIIDQHDLVSSVTRRNYVIEPEKTYSYDEATSLLKKRMTALNQLNAAGTGTVDGGEVNMVYQSRVQVNDIDIYLIRLDVKKSGITSAEGYYGVGIKNGVCYKVTGTAGSYAMSEY